MDELVNGSETAIVDAAEAQLNAETAAVSETPPVPKLPSPCMMVIYNFVRNDGTNGTTRIYLDGLYNIRHKGEIAQIEKLIVEQAKGEYAAVLITNWKSLEG